MSDIWIVEIYRKCTLEQDGYIGAKWEQYCDAEFSHPRWAVECARNVLRLNDWITPHNIRIAKVEWNADGGCWRLLDWDWLRTQYPAPKTHWKTDGF